MLTSNMANSCTRSGCSANNSRTRCESASRSNLYQNDHWSPQKFELVKDDSLSGLIFAHRIYELRVYVQLWHLRVDEPPFDVVEEAEGVDDVGVKVGGHRKLQVRLWA